MSMTEIVFSLIDQVSAQMGEMASAAESSMSEMESSADGASVSVDDIGTAADSAGTALDSVDGTALDEAGSAADAAATDLDTAANAADSAATATESINSTAIDEAAAAASSLGTSFDEAATGAEEAATKASDVGTSTSQASETSVLGAGMATAAVGTLTAGLEATAQSASKTNATFQKMSSTTFPESEVRGMVSALVSATFNTDDALLYIKTLKQIGVTGKASLSAGATAFNQIATATGVGSDRVVTFSNSMVAMGIDMNDIPSTFNAVAYANANMVGGFDTYVNWMAKYDSTFKSMGLTIDQTAILITGATKKFGGGRAAYSGLQTAINDSGGDLGKLATALDLSSDSLTNASAITGQYSGKIVKNSDITASNTTLVQQAQAAYAKLSVLFSGITGPIATYGGALSGIATLAMGVATTKAALATATATSTMAQNGETAATNVGIISKTRERAADMLSAASKAIRNMALTGETGLSITALGAAMAHTAGVEANTAATNLSATSYIRAAGTLVAQKVASVASTVATEGMAAAQWLLNAAMDANPIGIVVLAVVALVAILAVLYNKNETVRNAINALWGGLQSLGGYIMGGLMAAWNGIVYALNPIIYALSLLWTAISKVFSAFAASKSSQASSTFNQIANAAKWLWDILSQVVGVIGTTLTPVFNVLMTVLTAVGNVILSGFGAALTTVGGIITAIIGFIANVISILAALINGNITAGQAIGEVWDSIKGLIFDVLSAVYNGIGTWIITLLTQGVAAATGFVTSFVTWLSTLPMQIAYWLGFAIGRIILWTVELRIWAINAAIGFVTNLITWIATLPGRIWTWLVATVVRIANWRTQLIAYGRSSGTQLVNNFINFVRNLPATLWGLLLSAISRVRSFGSNAGSAARFGRFANSQWNTKLNHQYPWNSL